MAKPIANFSFIPNGLSVQFTDRSSGILVSWAWDFGDSTTSIVQNPPAHVYAQPGQYQVKLAATNLDGTDTLQMLLIFNTTPTISTTIQEMVEYNLPVGIHFDSIGFAQSIQTWQLYFQLSADVIDANVFDETKWPPLYNVLISRLIIKDLIIRAAATASVGAYVLSSEISSQTGTGTSTGSKGPVKAIEVGPSKAQFYDPSQFWMNLLKTNPDGSAGGIMAEIQEEICYYAGRLTIKIPGCVKADTLGRPPLVIHQRTPFYHKWPWWFNR